jgi:KEOPS complex subunit Pcc1
LVLIGGFNLEILSEFVFDLDNDIQVVYQSLLPELEGSHLRTCSELIIKGNSLILKVRSDDLVSMRASMNGWLRLIKIAVEMTAAIEN